MKLIDLFIPEIKFLLHKIYIPNQLQLEWTNYTSAYNKHVNTSPKQFLHYLLNVVLSNLVSKNLHKSLILTLDTMMKSLSMELATTENSKTYWLDVSQIINRVLANAVFNQSGAKLLKKRKSVHKKKSVHKRKKSRKTKT